MSGEAEAVTLAILIWFLCEYGQMLAEAIGRYQVGRWARLKGFFAVLGVLLGTVFL